MNQSGAHIALFLSLVFVANFACTKTGDLLPNVAPDTFISIDSISLVGDNRLNSRVQLSWFGTDKDGWIEGFEISFDNLTWSYTKSQDSLFQFTLPAGADTVDIELWIRAIDDKGAQDPQAAFLRIPLKNTPPNVAFEEKSLPGDSVRSVVTFRWNYSDRDGDESVTKAYLKLNSGPWQEIDRNQQLVSIVLDPSVPSGFASGDLYYGTQTQSALSIQGLEAEASNTFYLRVEDLGGAESIIDTSNTFFLKQKKNDVLLIGSQPISVRDVYKNTFDQAGISYDLEDYYANTSANAPKFWQPTFYLLIQLYDKLFIYTDPTTLPPNEVTGEESSLLVFVSSAIQQFTDIGGKSFTTTSFTPNSDITPLIGAFPIDGLIVSTGQARIAPDSGVFAMQSSIYPSLFPNAFDIGVDPIIKSADSENYFRGKLTKLSNWSGDNLIASRRLRSGNVNQVFFSIELHKYTRNPQELTNLIDQVFNDDFDW